MDERLSLTWGSLILMLVFTAVGTIVGGALYYYVQPFLPATKSTASTSA